MATLTFFHDKRSGSGEFPLKLRITHLRKAVHINLGIMLTPEQWDAEEERIVNHKKEATLNDYITTKRTMAEATIRNFGLNHNLDKFSASELKALVESGGESTTRSRQHNFLAYFEKVRDAQEKRNTWQSHESTIRKMKACDPFLDTRTFEDIDETYIRKMDEEWKIGGMTTNARGVYMRNIRSVINKAIKEKLTTTYAFDSFSIRKAPRNLSGRTYRPSRELAVTRLCRALALRLGKLGNVKNLVQLCAIFDNNVCVFKSIPLYLKSKTELPHSGLVPQIQGWDSCVTSFPSAK